MKRIFRLLILLCTAILSACTPQNAQVSTIIPKPTIESFVMPSPTSIQYQILGRIFPEGYDSAGVSANRNTGNPDSRNTHFDVAVPRKCRENSNNCPVISPVNGVVWEIYAIGNPKGSEGYVISINLSQPPEGVEKVVEQLGLDLRKTYEYSIHLGHLVGLNPDLKIGAPVKKGMLIADGVKKDPEPGVAYVLYINIKSNHWLQVSPCSVVNTSSFCGVCYQYRGDCPETNLNYPNGGIQWWNEEDPFWQTHKLSPR